MLEVGPPEEGAPVAEPDPVPPVALDPALEVEATGCAPALSCVPVGALLDPGPAEPGEPELDPVEPPFAEEIGPPSEPSTPALAPSVVGPVPFVSTEPEPVPAAGVCKPSLVMG